VSVIISNPSKLTLIFFSFYLGCDFLVKDGVIVVLSDETFGIVNHSLIMYIICNRSGLRKKVGSMD